MLKTMLGALAILISTSAASAQEMHPTCNKCPSTYIAKEEVDAFAQRAIANRIIDQQIRAVDAGKTNIDVGVVYRSKLDAPAPNSVAEHDHVSEVYHIIDGSATLMTGPDIIGAKPRPASEYTVIYLNGPGSNGETIKNGVSHDLKPGDVVIIPAGTGHWFTKIPDHITYLMIRVDPEKITPLKDAAAAKADLAGMGPARTTP